MGGSLLIVIGHRLNERQFGPTRVLNHRQPLILRWALAATAASIASAALLHAVGKITLFFCAGAIFVALHKKKISQ